MTFIHSILSPDKITFLQQARIEPTTVVRLQHFLLFGWSRRAGHSEGRRGEDKRTNAWVQARMVLMSCQSLPLAYTSVRSNAAKQIARKEGSRARYKMLLRCCPP